MPLLKPTYFFKQIIDINVDFLLQARCHGLILDIDDTLAPLGCATPSNHILNWINSLKSSNIKLVLASNNSEQRVSEFAKILNIPHVHSARKPLRIGLQKAIEILALPKENILMVGDQIFSDILGAKFIKINSILVEPLSPARNMSLKIRRRLERPIRKKLKSACIESEHLKYIHLSREIMLNEK